MLLIQPPPPTLSLKKFDLDRENRTLQISGRAAGIIGFLLSLLGVSPITTFTVFFDRIELVESKLSAQSRAVFPLPSVESTVCGHRRNIAYLIFAAVLVIVGLNLLIQGEAVLAIVVVLIGGILAVAFLFSQRLFISVYAGSQVMQLVFKEATIGGARIDRAQVMKAIDLINDRIAESQNT